MGHENREIGGAISRYIDRLIDYLDDRFKKWVDEKGYETLEDVKKGEKIGDEGRYVIYSWKAIAGRLDNVNMNVLNLSNVCLQMEIRVDAIKYLRNKGKIRIDVEKYLEERIFNEKNETNET